VVAAIELEALAPQEAMAPRPEAQVA